MKTDPSTLTIRDARPEELDTVALLLKDAYEQYARLIPADAWQSYLADIMDVKSRLEDSALIVAELEGRLAGAVTLYLDGSRLEVWPEGWAGIRLLAVHPKYRGRHIGHALMEECIRRCREKAIKTIGLHTTEAMEVARRMYERMGFVPMPELDFHPSPEAVVMAYKLELSG